MSKRARLFNFLYLVRVHSLSQLKSMWIVVLLYVRWAARCHSLSIVTCGLFQTSAHLFFCCSLNSNLYFYRSNWVVFNLFKHVFGHILSLLCFEVCFNCYESLFYVKNNINILHANYFSILILVYLAKIKDSVIKLKFLD